jgi:hypothetical protein
MVAGVVKVKIFDSRAFQSRLLGFPREAPVRPDPTVKLLPCPQTGQRLSPKRGEGVIDRLPHRHLPAPA